MVKFQDSEQLQKSQHKRCKLHKRSGMKIALMKSLKVKPQFRLKNHELIESRKDVDQATLIQANVLTPTIIMISTNAINERPFQHMLHPNASMLKKSALRF